MSEENGSVWRQLGALGADVVRVWNEVDHLRKRVEEIKEAAHQARNDLREMLRDETDDVERSILIEVSKLREELRGLEKEVTKLAVKVGLIIGGVQGLVQFGFWYVNKHLGG
jgi:hypothetical protein